MIPEGILFLAVIYNIVKFHFGIEICDIILDIFYVLGTSKQRLVCFGCGKRTIHKKKTLKENDNIWNCNICSTSNSLINRFTSVPFQHDCKNPSYCLLCTSNNKKNLELVRSREKSFAKKAVKSSADESVFCRECLHNQQILISALSYEAPPVKCSCVSNSI